MDQQMRRPDAPRGLTRRRRRRPDPLDDARVAALPKQATRYIKADTDQRGMYIRVPPDGPNVFVAVARDPYGKQIWTTLGTSDVMPIEQARAKARAAIKRIQEGLSPIAPPPAKPDSFRIVAENWLKRYARPKGLRTLDEIERILNVYVFPRWAERSFAEIKRSDVTALLDHVEDENGPRQADQVLSVTRMIANWHATRADNYVAPFTRGMARNSTPPRDRMLNDDELRALWKETETGIFGGLVRALLLTGQRLEKVRTMKWSDLSDDGVWAISRSSEREKGNAGDLKLPPLALVVIRAQPRFAGNEHVFTGRGHLAFNDLSESKRRLDAKLPPMPRWTLHDLRRSARSLMSRAGVPSDHAERVLGHAIGGVEGIYDRHAYFDEKADALVKLAALVERIINPPPTAVADMEAERRKRRNGRKAGGA
jgi:integrase